MDLGLKNKVALVMAASDGIGRATAFALAREGARVAICARRKERLEETAAAIRRETGATVEAVVADVARGADVTRFVDAAVMEFGDDRIDVLVTNTGGPAPKAFLETTDDDWHRAFEELVMGPVRAIRHAVPHMKHGGAVIALTSTSAKQPMPNLALSSALRPAVVALSKTLSIDLAPRNIRFNSILTGSIATERQTEVLLDRAQREGRPVDEVRAQRAKEIPLGRIGTPEELANAVAWLASPAGGFVNGVALAVDGGMIKAL